MRKQYQEPSLVKITIHTTHLLTDSNRLTDGNNITINTSTMDSGDGSDAVKTNTVRWDEVWE